MDSEYPGLGPLGSKKFSACREYECYVSGIMVGGEFKGGNSSLENAGFVVDSFVSFGRVRKIFQVQFLGKMSSFVSGS